MNAFEAIRDFEKRFADMGDLTLLIIDTYSPDIFFNSKVKIIDGTIYESKIETKYSTCPDNEHVETEDHGSWVRGTVHKRYGKITIYASFIEDKKEMTCHE